MCSRLAPQDWSQQPGGIAKSDERLHRNASMRVMIDGNNTSRSAGSAERDGAECEYRSGQSLHSSGPNGIWPGTHQRTSPSDSVKGIGSWITDCDTQGPPYEKLPYDLPNVTGGGLTAKSKDGTIIGRHKSSPYPDAPFAPYNPPPDVTAGSSAGLPVVSSSAAGGGLLITPWVLRCSFGVDS
jgi:hypothetical protein